jgi:hypothetical protein
MSTKKWDLTNIQLQKHTLEKTQACKKINTKWKFKLNTMFVPFRMRNKNHTI